MAWTLREQGVASEICDLLDANATEVYTACSFQDITGQRTRKVIQVLRYLEDRINAMIGIWGLDGAMAAEAAEKRAVDGDKALLNGPARAGTGLDQADVDMVMGPARGETHAPPIAPDASHETPVIEGEFVEADPVEVIEEETAEDAAEAVETAPVEVAGVRAPRPASDPLAPVMALSAEERIALFT
jgi:hypothetical protein